MCPAYLLGLAGQCNVKSLSFQAHFLSLAFEFITAGSDSFLDVTSDLVSQLTYNRSFLSGEFTHLFQNGSQFTFFAQESYTKVFQSLDIADL